MGVRKRNAASQITGAASGGAGWQGRHGYVQEHLGGIVQDREGLRAYVCGLKDMAASCRERLQQLGVDRRSILYEKYD